MIRPFPKPRLFPRPNLTRLQKAKRMTIALGILGQQCLVIAADTEENYGAQKYQSGKIASVWRGGNKPTGSIIVSGAGSGDHIDAASDEIKKAFVDFTGSMDEFESWLRTFIHEFYSKHVMPFVRARVESPEFELIIGARHEHDNRLWTTRHTTLSVHTPFAVVGINRGGSQALLRQLYKPIPNLHITSLLAAYVIRQAKLSSVSIGMDTEIRFIYLEGHSVVPDETIRAWEEIFSRYQNLQREFFSYVSGFIPMAPEKRRDLQEMMEELQKITTDLAALPAVVMPSASQK